MADHDDRSHRHLTVVPDEASTQADTAESATPAPECPGATEIDRPSDDGVRLRHVIGDVLRDERLRQGRTLADVAEEAAVSLPYLSEIERGTKEVSSDVLHVVHTALGLELADVLERSTTRVGRLEARAQRRGPMLLAA